MFLFLLYIIHIMSLKDVNAGNSLACFYVTDQTNLLNCTNFMFIVSFFNQAQFCIYFDICTHIIISLPYATV